MPMLTLSRGIGQSLMLNDDIEVIIQDIHRGYARISIKAPDDVIILRKELYLREQSEDEMDDVV